MFNSEKPNAEKEKSKTRLPWIDYAKGLANVLVVSRHLYIGIERTEIIQPDPLFLNINEVVYTFRMPLFFVLSGIFLYKGIQKRSLKDFVFNKLNMLLYPYVLWVTIHITIQILLKDYVNADRGLQDYLYIFIKPRAIDQFWFIYALFNCTFLFLGLVKLFKGNHWMILGVGVLFQFLFQFEPFKDVWVFNDVFHYFFYVALGNVISKVILNPEKIPEFSSFKWTMILLPVFALCQWYWLTHREGYSVNVFLETIIASVGTTLALNLAFIMAKSGRAKILPFIGKYSLWIYLMHPMPGAAMRVLLLNHLGITNLYALLSIQLVVATFLPILIYEVLQKMGFWFMFSLKKKKNKLRTNKSNGLPSPI